MSQVFVRTVYNSVKTTKDTAKAVSDELNKILGADPLLQVVSLQVTPVTDGVSVLAAILERICPCCGGPPHGDGDEDEDDEGPGPEDFAIFQAPHG